MKIGISSWTYSWAVGVEGFPKPACPLNAFMLLERAAQMEADVLQLADNCPVHALSAKEQTVLGTRAKELGVELEIGTRGTRPDRLTQYLAIAQRLNCRLVRTLPHDGDDRPLLDMAGCFIKEVLPEYERAGVKLGVENHDFYRACDLASMFDKIGSPWVGACLDPVNNLGQAESTREVFAALGRHTINFHCKDYTIRRKGSMLGFDVEGCPAGEGMLNLDYVSSELSGRGISWVIELWTPWQGDIESTTVLEAEWAARSIINLGRYKNG